jgi:5'-methylthioadenosine phosphorylase
MVKRRSGRGQVQRTGAGRKPVARKPRQSTKARARRGTKARPDDAAPVARIGIIGGSGLYEMEGFIASRSVSVSTPFGPPSDRIVLGELGGVPAAFLPRHGRGHWISPSELNFRANVYALKTLGVEAIIAVSAVGSLRAEIAPGHLVIPDQFIDRTRGRISTFFGDGVVAHVSFGDPMCPRLCAALATAGRSLGTTVHPSGTYLCMEGPQFSSRAESELYRTWGAHIIGMTNLQEAKLAREAQVCFATIAMVTDYDCWKTTAGEVDVQEILRVLNANVSLAQRMIATVIGEGGGTDATGEAGGPVGPSAAGGDGAAGTGLMAQPRTCGCATALRDAIITDRARLPAKARQLLGVLGADV